MSESDSKYDRLLDLAEVLELDSAGYVEIIAAKNRISSALSLLGVASISDIPAQTEQVGADGLISGGQVSWIGLLNFVVSAATYRIGGVDYSSPQVTLTLTAADATNPRIDMLVVNTSGVAAKVDGTPAGSPSAPSVDPATQIALTFILVAANATTPSNISKGDIYLENTEWTVSQTGSAFTAASTNNPFAGTKDIEATSAVAGNVLKLTKPAAGTETLSNYNTLAFFIRFKAAWPNSKSLSVSFLNGSTQIGQAVTVKPGLFNLDGSNITSYQQVLIPLTSFNALTPITALRFTVVGGGAAIGFYLDNISLQAGVVANPLPTGLMIFKGTFSSTVAYQQNDVVVSSGSLYIAKVGSTGATISDTNFWTPLASAAAALSDSINFVIDGGGSEITTGVKGFIEVPFACTINRVEVLADQSGSIVVDIWKDTYANYPPDNSDSITASAPPTISSATKSQDATLTGWTTSIAAGDILGYNVDSVTTCQRVTVSLKVTRT